MTTDSPSAILRDFLIADGLFTDPQAMDTFPVFRSHMPDEPDDAGTVFDTAGLKDGRLQSGANVLHPGIQVRVRSSDYSTGWSKIQAVEARMETLHTETVVIGSITYTLENLSQSGPALSLGREKTTKRRNLFTLNLLATIKES